MVLSSILRAPAAFLGLATTCPPGSLSRRSLLTDGDVDMDENTPDSRTTYAGSYAGTSSSLGRLPDDLIVDEVFGYLEIQDILRIRRVSKLYWYLTHHPLIWKRLLRLTTLPLPPLPPISRYSLSGLTGVEAERTITRGLSIDYNWRREKPRVIRCLQHTDDFYHRDEFHSMCMLPGGRFLVASVSDHSKTSWSVRIYGMDYYKNVLTFLASSKTRTKAFGLKARYMPYNGKMGIAIAFITRETSDPEDQEFHDVSRLSEDCADLDDYPVPLDHICTSMHAPLDLLERVMEMGATRETYKVIGTITRRIRSSRYSTKISAVDLAMIDQTPHAIFIRHSSPAAITFMPLCPESSNNGMARDGKSESRQQPERSAITELRLIRPDAYPEPAEFTVLTFRILPSEAKVMAVTRAVKDPVSCSTSDVGPPSDTVRDFSERVEAYRIRAAEGGKPRSVDDRFYVEMHDVSKRFSVEPCHPLERHDLGNDEFLITGSTRFIISDLHPAYDGDASVQTQYPGWQNHEPPPLTLFIHRFSPRPTITYAHFWPQRILEPDVPLGHEPSSSTDTRVKPKYRYDLAGGFWQHTLFLDESPLTVNREVRICPGASNSVMYTIPVDNITDHPPILDILSFASIERRPEVVIAEEQQEMETWLEYQRRLEYHQYRGQSRRLLVAKVETRAKTLQWALSKGVRALAWDETIGRLVIAPMGGIGPFVLDFAYAPRFDFNGQRLPVPVVRPSS